MAQEFEAITLGVQCSCINGGFELQSRLLSGHCRQICRLEPAVFFHLVVRDSVRSVLGPHNDYRLKFTFYFSGLTPDKKLADIKFCHLLPSPGLASRVRPEPVRAQPDFYDVREYGSC